MLTGTLTKPFLKGSKKGKLSIQEQLEFLQRLSRFIKNGYPLLDALQMLSWQQKWKDQVGYILETLKNGQRLDVALNHAKFHKTVISFMFFAMEDGDLESALDDCCLMLNQQLTTMHKIKITSRYPLLLLLFFMILLFFIKTSVYPSFLQLFDSTTDTAKITTIAISSVNILYQGCIILFLVISLLVPLWLFIKNKLTIRTLIRLYKRIPFIRSLVTFNNSFLFALHLSSLLNAGISLRECLHILSNQSQLPIISYNAKIIIAQLEIGNPITLAFSNCSLLTTQFISIFNKNITNDALAKDLNIFAEFLIESLETKIKRLINIIQPTSFMIIGALIILVYLSLMLPMFQLINNL